MRPARHAMLAGLLLLGSAGTFAQPASTTLWYAAPAGHWLEALPIGNGRMGGMVFGGTGRERIQFNEQTLWLGTEQTKQMGSYQPFGDLFFDLAQGDTPITDYRRELDLKTAVSRVRYSIDGVEHRRECFASHSAGVIVMRLTASRPGQTKVRVRLQDARGTAISAADDTLSFAGTLAAGLDYPAAAAIPGQWGAAGGWGVANDLSYAAGVRVLTEGGTITRDTDSLKVDHADAVTVLLAAATDYAQNPEKKWRGPPPAPLVAARLTGAARAPYAQLLAAHIADHQSLFRRVELDLGESPVSAQPTDQRLIAVKGGARDPALAALLFNYGRYLLIASSRPGGLPANLQGLWNDNPKPAWYSGYTTNINIEMNYWPAETTALPECHQPLLDWVEMLATAQKRSPDPQLQTPVGWIIYSTNNPFGGNSGWALHRPGSAWLSQHFWEHYAFGGDRRFLADRAYPLLKEITLYWINRLVPGPDGSLISPDGWSPEWGPVWVDGKRVLKDGDRTPIPGVSYDQQIVWDLFTNFIEASEALGIDADLRARIAAGRARLLGPKIGRLGQIQEWMEDIDEPRNPYRHIAHLFAVHPGRQISPLRTPELAEAAKVSLNSRGDTSVGWSRAWKVCFWARLHDGDRAEQIVRHVLEPVASDARGSGSYPNLFGAGPPFQIDANFGATAGVAEMLLQSHLHDESGARLVHLLPALPAAWTDGRVSGLRARGGLQVDMTWRKSRLSTARVRSDSGASIALHYGGEIRRVHLKPGEVYDW